MTPPGSPEVNEFGPFSSFSFLWFCSSVGRYAATRVFSLARVLRYWLAAHQHPPGRWHIVWDGLRTCPRKSTLSAFPVSPVPIHAWPFFFSSRAGSSFCLDLFSPLPLRLGLHVHCGRSYFKVRDLALHRDLALIGSFFFSAPQIHFPCGLTPFSCFGFFPPLFPMAVAGFYFLHFCHRWVFFPFWHNFFPLSPLFQSAETLKGGPSFGFSFWIESSSLVPSPPSSRGVWLQVHICGVNVDFAAFR